MELTGKSTLGTLAYPGGPVCALLSQRPEPTVKNSKRTLGSWLGTET